MPRKTSAETLEEFVRRQDAATLASVLIELAADNAAVHDRLVRLQLSTQPSALAAEFRKSLAAWRRSTKYLGWSEAGGFGRELEAWLAQIEHELLPQDPAAALALAEAFIEADDVFFNHADDSNGAIGDAIRAGCRLWLKAASRCESPATQWPARIAALVAADEYGAREELLRCANLLLDEDALRALVASYEAQVDDALARAASDSERVNWPAAQASAALSLLSKALRDPDVLVRATLKCSPSPNPIQKESLVHAFLKYDRPEGALRWLEGSWVQQHVGHLVRNLLLQHEVAARGLRLLGRHPLEDLGQLGRLHHQRHGQVLRRVKRLLSFTKFGARRRTRAAWSAGLSGPTAVSLRQSTVLGLVAPSLGAFRPSLWHLLGEGCLLVRGGCGPSTPGQLRQLRTGEVRFLAENPARNGPAGQPFFGKTGRNQAQVVCLWTTGAYSTREMR